MNIRPDTVLHQVISDLLGEARRASRPAATAPAAPEPAAAKKLQAAAAAGDPTGPAPSPSAPGSIKPRGSVVNILA